MTLTKFFEDRFRWRKSDPFAIVEKPISIPLEKDLERASSQPADADVVTQEPVGDLKEDIKKLGRTQLRANTVAEAERREIKKLLQEVLASSKTSEPEQNALADLLVVADGLEQAIQAGKNARTVDTTAAAWEDGLRIIHERLLHVLQKWQVIPIEAVGQTFDPHLHQAVEAVHAGDVPENTVVSCHRRGYLYQGCVLRYAEVTVARKDKGTE